MQSPWRGPHVFYTLFGGGLGGGRAYRGEGITSVKFILVPCGVNVPHTHPRATEVLNVVAGGPLLVGWVNTSGSKSFD